MTNTQLKLKIGGDPANPKHWENCTVGANCKRHVHLERIKDQDFDASLYELQETDADYPDWDEDQTLTISSLINRLLVITPTSIPVVVKFLGSFYPPAELISYRGYYEDLAITPNMDTDAKEVTVSQLITKLNNIIGEELTGWKGGKFEMTQHTSVWVDVSGDVNNQAAVDVQVADGVAVILTKTVSF